MRFLSKEIERIDKTKKVSQASKRTQQRVTVVPLQFSVGNTCDQ